MARMCKKSRCNLLLSLSLLVKDKNRCWQVGLLGRSHNPQWTHLLWAQGGEVSAPDTSSWQPHGTCGSPPSLSVSCLPVPAQHKGDNSVSWIQTNTPTWQTTELFKSLTFEAFDWLSRSFCSKILEYFFRSFLIALSIQRNDKTQC